MMRRVPAFFPLLMLMAAIARSDSAPDPGPYMPTMPKIPMFDLEKYWKCYTDLWSNPMQAFMDPMKVWNTMMCGWVTPGSAPSGDKPKAPEAPAKTDAAKPARQGSGPIDISPEAALALTMFRREYQRQQGGQALSSNSVNRWPVPGQFSYIPPVSMPRIKPGLPIIQAGGTTFGGEGGMYSPFVSQPFFYVMPVRGQKGDDSSSEEDEDESTKPRLPSVGPSPIVITSQPFPPPFGGTGGRVQLPPRPRPHAVYQGGRPRGHQNIIVNQAGDGQQTLITRGGGWGSGESISVIQR